MESLVQDTIESRVQSVLAKIRSAAEKAGRPASSVRLVAATKTVPVQKIAEGVQAGLSILGENRVQEALSMIPSFAILFLACNHHHLLDQTARSC